MKQYELIEDIYRSLARIESLIDTGAVHLRAESGQTAVTERKSFFSYMKSAAICSTMSPGVKIDLKAFLNGAE